MEPIPKSHPKTRVLKDESWRFAFSPPWVWTKSHQFQTTLPSSYCWVKIILAFSSFSRQHEQKDLEILEILFAKQSVGIEYLTN